MVNKLIDILSEKDNKAVKAYWPAETCKTLELLQMSTTYWQNIKISMENIVMHIAIVKTFVKSSYLLFLLLHINWDFDLTKISTLLSEKNKVKLYMVLN